MKNISAQGLRNDIKRHVTMQKLLTQYGCETPEALFTAIRRSHIYPNPAVCEKQIKVLLDSLSSKDYIISSSSESTVNEVTDNKTSYANNYTYDYVSDDTMDEKIDDGIDDITHEVSDASKSLDDLKKSEEELSKYLCTLEVSRQSLIRNHQSCVEQLQVLSKNLEKLMEELISKKNQVANLFVDCSKISDELGKINAEHYEASERITAIREEIAIKSKIVLYVFDDKIESDSVEMLDVVYDASAVKSIANNLWLTLDETSNLSITQLYTIAKLTLVIKKISEQNFAFEIVFDNLEMEALYQTAK